MVKLNTSQIKMRLDFLEKFIKERLKQENTSEFCFLCNHVGDVRDSRSMFTTFIPPNDPGNPASGLIMDDIKAIWVCSPCVSILKNR